MLVNLGKGLLACHFHKMMTNTSISYGKAGHVVIELGGSDQKGMVTLQVQDRQVSSKDRPICYVNRPVFNMDRPRLIWIVSDLLV